MRCLLPVPPGPSKNFSDEQVSYFKKLLSLKLKNPFLIGFGISNQKTYSQACAHAAGAIVGSSFITMLKNSKDLKEDVEGFIKAIRVEG